MAKRALFVAAIGMALLFQACSGCDSERKEAMRAEIDSLRDCAKLVGAGFRPIAAERGERFLGKVADYTAGCRGGEWAKRFRAEPWVDWANYWAAGDASSKASEQAQGGIAKAIKERIIDEGQGHINPNGRGVDGALLDLEYERIELVKFNLMDNYTYDEYVDGRDGVPGPSLKTWEEMRLPADHPRYREVGGDAEQLCGGQLIRHRTTSGICNDLRNPLMGAAGTLFARNSQFETTFPRLGRNEMVRNRHGDRLGLLEPDPAVISEKLLTRAQSTPETCNQGKGVEGYPADANCDYQKAPFFNVLAAFWIQFMTHDWFSHLEEGKNQDEMMPVGGGREMEQALVAQSDEPPTYSHDGQELPARAPRTFANNNTAWWDASSIYGYSEASQRRVKRDPEDPAKLLMVQRGDHPGDGEAQGYLPIMDGCSGPNCAWTGQESTGFADNWNIGLSFYHNVFAREHNAFVTGFRGQTAATPDADSGLRNPDRPDDVITYSEVTDEELFQAARLVVSAVIAKIHTIEWTTQLLYDEPLYLAMNANWGGLFDEHSLMSRAMEKITVQNFGKSEEVKKATQWYSVFASGPGIFGLGSRVYEDDRFFARLDRDAEDLWSITNPDHVNGGINHFGSPFNFPEEFTTVYRLHPLVPDLIEYRDWQQPNAIAHKIPVVETFRKGGTEHMNERGIANWTLSMGRQRLGLLTLQNHAAFLQNLEMPRLGEGFKLDVPALDLIRDREHGVPRFNEFRRQYGLRQLTGFGDFVDKRLEQPRPGESRDQRTAREAALAEQRRLVGVLREVYGTHVCDDSKVITTAQLMEDGSPITDCLGHPDGTEVDNIEDVDTVVGWLAEFPRPHGFAISETQFVVFILNASRRLFSDRFFTSSFRPEFYTTYGLDWVINNGPGPKQWEPVEDNGHKVEVSAFKRVLQRTVPELREQLEPVVNVFDPWARDRGDYYSLEWKARPGAEEDPAFGGSM